MNQAELFAPDRVGAAIALGPVGRVVSLAVVAVAIVAYVAGPILDQRIPEVFRHIDWVSYSRAAQRFVDGQPLYTAAQLAGPYRMADVAGLGYVSRRRRSCCSSRSSPWARRRGRS